MSGDKLPRRESDLAAWLRAKQVPPEEAYELGHVLGGDAVEVQVHVLPGGQRPRLRAAPHGRRGVAVGPVTFVPGLAA